MYNSTNTVSNCHTRVLNINGQCCVIYVIRMNCHHTTFFATIILVYSTVTVPVFYSKVSVKVDYITLTGTAKLSAVNITCKYFTSNLMVKYSTFHV